MYSDGVASSTDLPVGDELEEEAGGGGAEQLGDPVEDPGEDGDVAADGKAEGHCRVEVPAGDVGGDRDADEEREGVGDRDGHEASRVQSAITGQFACRTAETKSFLSNELHASY